VALSSPVDDDELDAYLRARLVSYKLPRTFERVAGPLRDDAGKVRRPALRADRLPGPNA
jgi:bile acid-coenzyme A ligase